jgi:hypothetical protein
VTREYLLVGRDVVNVVEPGHRCRRVGGEPISWCETNRDRCSNALRCCLFFSRESSNQMQNSLLTKHRALTALSVKRCLKRRVRSCWSHSSSLLGVLGHGTSETETIDFVSASSQSRSTGSIRHQLRRTQSSYKMLIAEPEPIAKPGE